MQPASTTPLREIPESSPTLAVIGRKIAEPDVTEISFRQNRIFTVGYRASWHWDVFAVFVSMDLG